MLNTCEHSRLAKLLMTTPAFDFSDIPIVDMHVHGPLEGSSPGGLFGLNQEWYNYFVNGLLPKDFTDKNVRAELLSEVIRSHESRPSWTAVKHYVRGVYALDSAVTCGDGSLEQQIIKEVNRVGIKRFAGQVFNRENIEWVLVDHSSITYEPRPMMDDFPEGRTKWTHPIIHLLQPRWAFSQGLETSDSISYEIKKELHTAKKNSVVGFKSTQAYFRDFDLSNVDEDAAQGAFDLLSKSKPERYEDFKGVQLPHYARTQERAALKTYQDYLLKTIFTEAGRMGAAVVIHVAVWVTPTLKPGFNDPEKLYSIFDNDDIRRANTKFILLHTGYPETHKISSIITQYPNVWVDLSCPTLLKESILGEFLKMASPTKIMHGSDGSHPEFMAYAAHDTRACLSEVSKWFYEKQHFSESECREMAELVLNKNANRLFPTQLF